MKGLKNKLLAVFCAGLFLAPTAQAVSILEHKDKKGSVVARFSIDGYAFTQYYGSRLQGYNSDGQNNSSHRFLNYGRLQFRLVGVAPGGWQFSTYTRLYFQTFKQRTFTKLHLDGKAWRHQSYSIRNYDTTYPAVTNNWSLSLRHTDYGAFSFFGLSTPLDGWVSTSYFASILSFDGIFDQVGWYSEGRSASWSVPKLNNQSLTFYYTLGTQYEDSGVFPSGKNRQGFWATHRYNLSNNSYLRSFLGYVKYNTEVAQLFSTRKVTKATAFNKNTNDKAYLAEVAYLWYGDKLALNANLDYGVLTFIDSKPTRGYVLSLTGSYDVTPTFSPEFGVALSRVKEFSSSYRTSATSTTYVAPDRENKVNLRRQALVGFSWVPYENKYTRLRVIGNLLVSNERERYQQANGNVAYGKNTYRRAMLRLYVYLK